VCKQSKHGHRSVLDPWRFQEFPSSEVSSLAAHTSLLLRLYLIVVLLFLVFLRYGAVGHRDGFLLTGVPSY